ncbi:hypothetical protein ACFQ0M_48730 [Kitasatospora aburaviensis]
MLDGELIAVTPDGNLSFALLQTRSGKGPRPGAGFAVQVAAFDLLALDDVDTRPLPYEERNRRLVKLLAAGPPQIRPLPVTDDLAEARTWVGRLNGGVEGLLLKPAASRYVGGGYGSGWRKWRERHPVDAVVVGIVPAANPRQQAAVLAQPDARGRLRAVGVSLPSPTSCGPSSRRCCGPSATTWPSCPASSAASPAAPRSATCRSSPPSWSRCSSIRPAPNLGGTATARESSAGARISLPTRSDPRRPHAVDLGGRPAEKRYRLWSRSGAGVLGWQDRESISFLRSATFDPLPGWACWGRGPSRGAPSFDPPSNPCVARVGGA